MMKHFFRDVSGNTSIWAAFLIIILFTLSFVVYSAVTVYAKFQICEKELERASIVAVDTSMINSNVRDSLLDIPAIPAQTLLANNLSKAGWVQEGGAWAKREEDKLVYSLEDMTVEIEGKAMRIDAVFSMPSPWMIGDTDEIHMPIQVRSSILYIE